MICDSTVRKLQALLSGAIATTNPTVLVDYVDLTSTSTTPGATLSNLNGVTAVDILAAPASSTQRKVNGISIYNADTAAVIVTVRYNDNTTLYTLIVATLAVGETLCYTDAKGWYALSSSGETKTTSSGGNGRFLHRTIRTSGTSFTVGPTTNTVKITIRGNGGGGGGIASAAASSGAAGGGSAGGYVERVFTVTPSAAVTFSFGAGAGAGGTAGANNGTAGANVTATAAGVTITANGGPGGIGGTASATVQSLLGGAAPAVSTNGDLNGSGSPGDDGLTLSAALAVSGDGGSCEFGGGGVSKNTHGAGNNATGFGSGGSGACCISGGGNVAGGNGAGGVIVIEEYS